MDATTQGTLLPTHNGQPSAWAAWNDARLNERTNGFYRTLAANMATAYTRPTYQGLFSRSSRKADGCCNAGGTGRPLSPKRFLPCEPPDIPEAVEWTSDEKLFTLMRRFLCTPVMGDVLDQLGFLHHFPPQPIQPMLPEMRLAGRAMPAVMANVFEKQQQPFGRLTKVLEQLRQGRSTSPRAGRCAVPGGARS